MVSRCLLPISAEFDEFLLSPRILQAVLVEPTAGIQAFVQVDDVLLQELEHWV